MWLPKAQSCLNLVSPITSTDKKECVYLAPDRTKNEARKYQKLVNELKRRSQNLAICNGVIVTVTHCTRFSTCNLYSSSTSHILIINDPLLSDSPILLGIPNVLILLN